MLDLRKLRPYLANDSVYLACLQELSLAEKSYQAVLETLAPEQQRAITRYLDLCEEADHLVAQLAYQLGMAHAGDT